MDTEITELMRPAHKPPSQPNALQRLCLCCYSHEDVLNETTTSPNMCSIPDFYFPKRVGMLIMLTLGMTIINAMRVNVGVTVVAILHKTASSKVSKPETMAGISNLHWSSTMVGWLHSMFYLGILVSQVPCGYIVTKFPSTRLFGGSIFISGLVNFIIPVSITSFGYVTTCAFRFIQGLSEGMIYPSLYDILRIWSLPEEKSRMGATVLTGSYIGPVLGMFFSGLLTHYWGWHYVYYAHGFSVLLWYMFWFFLAFPSPSQHPCISPDEQKLIATRQGEALVIYEEGPVPWLSILTSPAVWSLNICNYARSSVFYMLLTNQPTYFHLFEFTFVENGLFSSLPHAMMALMCIISGPLADLLMARPTITTTFVRKLFTCVGFGVEGMFFFGLAVVNTKEMSVTLLTVALGVSGLAISGWQINHLDIAPRYAGILIAITMTFGTLAGVLNPLIVASLTKNQTFAGWHNVFWITGAILIFSTIFYLIFGTGDRQPWSSPQPPVVHVIGKVDISKPYGTFTAQTQIDAMSDFTEEGVAETELNGDGSDGGDGGDGGDGVGEKDGSDLKQRHPR